VIILEPDNTVIPLSTVANLNAGESINLSVEVTFVTEGRNTLRVRVDDNNNVDEQFESNNENTYQVDVIAE
jgi:subtilase family serine protease